MTLNLNLGRFIHPSFFRRLRVRHKQTALAVFIFFLIYFMLRDREEGKHSGDSGRNRVSDREDELVVLRSQLGFLKNKLAKKGVNIDPNDDSMPTIYAITPTYARPVQKAELTRLCYTFLLVPNFHWIVVEDAKVKSKLVTNLLKECGDKYTHLNVKTPKEMKLKETDHSWRKPRGVLQRNEALHWIRDNVPREVSPVHSHPRQGVVYLADDDNTYSLELFEEMRWTQRVSVWPVGLVGGLMVEKPHVVEGKVVGWDTVWSPKRPFAIDMAGFAISLQLFLSSPKAKFAYEVKRGYQESEFLKHVVNNLSELEPKADMCTKVLVWHTRSEKVKLDMEVRLEEDGKLPSNEGIEV